MSTITRSDSSPAARRIRNEHKNNFETALVQFLFGQEEDFLRDHRILGADSGTCRRNHDRHQRHQQGN